MRSVMAVLCTGQGEYPTAERGQGDRVGDPPDDGHSVGDFTNVTIESTAQETGRTSDNRREIYYSLTLDIERFPSEYCQPERQSAHRTTEGKGHAAPRQFLADVCVHSFTAAWAHCDVQKEHR